MLDAEEGEGRCARPRDLASVLWGMQSFIVVVDVWLSVGRGQLTPEGANGDEPFFKRLGKNLQLRGVQRDHATQQGIIVLWLRGDIGEDGGEDTAVPSGAIVAGDGFVDKSEKIGVSGAD